MDETTKNTLTEMLTAMNNMHDTIVELRQRILKIELQTHQQKRKKQEKP